MAKINDNNLDLGKYRGEVRRCPLCGSRTPSAAVDAMTSGRACRMCFGHGFVAVCTNCAGTGQYKGTSVWDGGRSEHTSTCTPCGGQGVYATRKPASWVDASPIAEPLKAIEPASTSV